jgi:hypothetical protein
MPSKSAAQHRLMEAAAHTKGGFGGVPQKVGKEFVKADEGKKFKEGGSSKVNQAGNYTKPEMRKRLFDHIKGESVQGTAAGQWSARKAQLLAKRYKEKGGGYRD